jgi:hypothetical protein
MDPLQSPPASFDHGPNAGPFRAFDYSAPTFTPADSGGFALKFVAIGAAVAAVVTTVGIGVYSAAQGWSELEAEQTGKLVAIPFVLLYGGAILAWIYKSWEFLPREMRRNAAGRTFEPAGSALSLLVPFYNLYWIFVQSLGLCDALDAALVQSGKTPSAPRNLAVACGVVQVIPILNWTLGPFLWMTYMFLVDRTKRQLLPPR